MAPKKTPVKDGKKQWDAFIDEMAALDRQSLPGPVKAKPAKK